MSQPTQTETQATQNIDVIATTEKIFNQLDSMSFDAILRDWIIPYGTKVLVNY